jgi:hypothetical protein
MRKACHTYEAVFGPTTFAVDLILAADSRVHEMTVGVR